MRCGCCGGGAWWLAGGGEGAGTADTCHAAAAYSPAPCSLGFLAQTTASLLPRMLPPPPRLPPRLPLARRPRRLGRQARCAAR